MDIKKKIKEFDGKMGGVGESEFLPQEEVREFREFKAKAVKVHAPRRLRGRAVNR